MFLIASEEVVQWRTKNALKNKVNGLDVCVFHYTYVCIRSKKKDAIKTSYNLQF